jgi:hypothetical protein
MIEYVDTSAFVKLYVDEEHSDAVATLVGGGAIVATSVLTYAEMRAGLARARRTGRLTAAELRAAVADLDGRFVKYVGIAASTARIRRAGELAEQHALRGYDAVQLACALQAQRILRDSVRMVTFDDDLRAAAAAESLDVLTL